MIWYYLVLFIGSVVTGIFSFLPHVNTLPEIAGVDIDGALVDGFNVFYTVAHSLWYLWDVWLGCLFLLAYYAIKMVLKMLLGHRAPGKH